MANSATTAPKSAPAPVSPSPVAAPAPAESRTPTLGNPAERRQWAPGGAAIPRPDRAAGIKASLETITKLSGEKAADAPVVEVEEQARNPDGTFAPKGGDDASTLALVNEATAPKADAKKEQPKAETPKVEASKFSADDREKAETALRRTKVPESALKGLSEEDRVQWGLDLAKSQSEYDRKVTELSKGKGKETQHADSGQAPEQPATSSNLRSLIDALALDEQGGRLLAGTLADMEGKHTALLAAQAEEIASMEQTLSYTLAYQARAALAKEFPDLMQKDVWPKVTERMQRMMESGAYEHIDDPMESVELCMRDATGIECRDSIIARTKEAARKESARRDAGQPAGIGKVGNAGKMNKREHAIASLKLMEANPGMTGDQARARLLGG